MVPKKSGLQLIIDERMEQVNKYGHMPEHDDKLTSGELIFRASCYLRDNAKSPELKKLVRTGAMIAAEIDRLLRAQERANTESPAPMTCQGKDSTKCVGPRCAHYPDKHDQDEYCTMPGICGYSCLPSGESKPAAKQVVCPLGEHCVVGVCSHKEKHDVKDGCFEGNKLCPGCVPVEEESDPVDKDELIGLERGQPVLVWNGGKEPRSSFIRFFDSFSEDMIVTFGPFGGRKNNATPWDGYRLPTEEEMEILGLDKNRWKYTKD